MHLADTSPAVCVQSFATDLRNLTKDHQRMKCYALGLGLDTFRMVALTENFRRLDIGILLSAFRRCEPLAHVDSAIGNK